MFAWPYYDLIDGLLYVRRGKRPILAFREAPRFANVEEAEAWLVANNIRGNVR